MPAFLCEEMRDYIKSLYGVKPTDRIFTVTKSYLHREMDRGEKEAGVKRVRIHDLRDSHVSLLIDMGYTALAIPDRVGHESIDITYRYAHPVSYTHLRRQGRGEPQVCGGHRLPGGALPRGAGPGLSLIHICGFSPAGGADQRHRFTGGNVQRDIVQHRLVLPVFEDVYKRQPSVSPATP